MFVLLCALLSAHPSWALGFGPLQTYSALGQPLRAEIALNGTPEEISALRVSLAPHAEFDKANIYYGASLQNLHFAIDRNAQGRPIVRVTTNAPVKDPFLDFLLEGIWPGGRVINEYTLLLDPVRSAARTPVRGGHASAPPANAATSPYSRYQHQPPQPQAYSNPAYPAQQKWPPPGTRQRYTTRPATQPVAPARPSSGGAAGVQQLWPRQPTGRTAVPSTPAPARLPAYTPATKPSVSTIRLTRIPKSRIRSLLKNRTSGSRSASRGSRRFNTSGQDVRVVRGDTLSGIARRYAVPGVSLKQMLAGLYRNNRHAFIRNNMHLVRSGAVLSIPDESDLRSTSRSAAKRVYRAHTSQWRSYLTRLAEASEDAQREDHFESASKTDNTVASGVIGAEVKTEESEGTQSTDTVTVTPTQTAARQERDAVASQTAKTEAAVTASKETEDLQTRIAMLKNTLDNQQQLLTLRVKELAKLQKGAEDSLNLPDFTAEISAAQNTKDQRAQLSMFEQIEQSMQKTLKTTSELLLKLQRARQAEPKPETDLKAEPESEPEFAPELEQQPEEAEIEPTSPQEEPGLFEDPVGTIIGHVNKLLGMLAGLGLMVLLLPLLLIVLLVLLFKYLSSRRQTDDDDSNFSSEFSTSSFSDYSTTGMETTGGDFSQNEEASPKSVYENWQAKHEKEPDADSDAPQSVAGATTPPPLTDFSQAGLGRIDTDDVDPVAEADVYMAYGRDAQAEEILVEAMQRDPSRTVVHAKLLEIYAKRNMGTEFETVASELYAQTHGSGPDWEKASVLGREIDPDNPLYGGSSGDGESRKEEVSKKSDPLEFDTAASPEAAVSSGQPPDSSKQSNKESPPQAAMTTAAVAASAATAAATTAAAVASPSPEPPPQSLQPLELSADDTPATPEPATPPDAPSLSPSSPPPPPLSEDNLAAAPDLDLSLDETPTSDTAVPPSLSPLDLDFDTDKTATPNATPAATSPLAEPVAEPVDELLSTDSFEKQPDTAPPEITPATSGASVEKSSTSRDPGGFSLEGTLIDNQSGGKADGLDFELEEHHTSPPQASQTEPETPQDEPQDEKSGDDMKTGGVPKVLTGSVLGANFSLDDEDEDEKEESTKKEEKKDADDDMKTGGVPKVLTGSVLGANFSLDDEDEDEKDESAEKEEKKDGDDDTKTGGVPQVLTGSLLGGNLSLESGDENDQIAGDDSQMDVQEMSWSDAIGTSKKEADTKDSPPGAFDMSEINLDLDAPEAIDSSSNEVADSQWDEVGTKLDLAKAYEEMGDPDGSRELLQEVVNEGSPEQIQQAQGMLDRLQA